jgi:hypothetical protein
MAVVVTHPFVSAIADSGDTSIVQPSDWNANHVVTGLATVAETGAYADLTGKPALASVGTVTIDFGTSGSLATATLTAPWITLSSVLVVSPGGATADHDAEDVLIEQIQASVSAVAAGSCTVMAFAPAGTWGRYTFNVVGI